MICMVRHGQTNQNKKLKIQGQSDFPLNETGILQAISCGNYILNNYKFDLIISSPLSRAIETALEIKRIINYKKNIIIDERFIERAFGEAEGLDICDKVFDRVLNDDYNGLEKSYEIQERVINGLNDLFDKYKDLNILIVTHSHTIKAALTYLDKNLKFDSKLGNCCLNVFEKDNEIIIKKYNESPFN